MGNASRAAAPEASSNVERQQATPGPERPRLLSASSADAILEESCPGSASRCRYNCFTRSHSGVEGERCELEVPNIVSLTVFCNGNTVRSSPSESFAQYYTRRKDAERER
jgi:hypothetical protein